MADPQELIRLKVEADIEDASRALKNFGRAQEVQQKKLEATTKKTYAKTLRVYKNFWAQQNAAAKLDRANRGKVEEAHKLEQALLQKLKLAQSDLSAAQVAGNKNAVAAVQKNIAAIRKQFEETQDAHAKALEGAEESRKKIAETMQKDFELDFESPALKEAASGLGDGMGEAFSSLASKDALGIGQGIAKAFSKASFAAMKNWGGRMAVKGRAIGEDANAGKMAKMLGSVMRGIGPLMNTLGKLGPILGMVGGAIMSLVKLFLDAEAGAKEFNREILATASTTHFLDRGATDSTLAVDNLKRTLDSVREAAFDVSNVEWGLNKDDYKATMQELQSQGVRLDTLRTQAEQAYVATHGIQPEEFVKDTKLSDTAIKELTQRTVRFSAAYARSMGVSVQEVSALMGEMQGQLGQPLQAVESAFNKITIQAQDSTIAGNQFFNIIRGMSADMNLFNNRMEMAGQVLSQIAKVMDPRRAGQFVQSLQNFFKGKSLQERIKAVATGGVEATRENLKERQQAMVGALAKDLESFGITPAQVEEAVSKGTKGVTELIASNERLNTESASGIREALITAATQNKKLQGGMINLASGLKDTDMVGVYKQVQLQASRMFKTSVENLTEQQLLAAEQAISTDEEFIAQMQKFRVALDLTQQRIAKQIETQGASPEQIKLLKDLGIKYDEANKKAAADALRQVASDRVFDKLSYTEQQALQQGKKTIDFAKKTSGFQTSLLERLQTLVDFMMNQFYDAVLGIWERITSSRLFGDDESRAQVALAKASKESRSSAVAAAQTGAKDSWDFRNRLVASKEMQQMVAQAKGDKPESSQLRHAMAKKASDEEIGKAIQSLASTNKDFEASVNKTLREKGVLGTQVSAASGTLDVAKVGAGARSALTSDQLKQLFEPLAYQMDPAKLAREFTSLQTTAGTALTPEQQLANSQAAVEKGMMNVGQKDANAATIQTNKSAHDGHSLDTHDHTAEALLISIAEALGATNDVVKTPELSEAQFGNELAESQMEEQVATRASLADIYNVLRIKGIRVNQSHLNSDVKRVITEGSQEAMETALFEYALMTDTAKANRALQEAASKGGSVTGSAIMRNLYESSFQMGKKGELVPQETPLESAASTVANSLTSIFTPTATPPPPAPVPTAPAVAAGGVVGVLNVHIEMAEGAEKFIRAIADEQVQLRMPRSRP